MVHPALAALYAADRARCAGGRDRQEALWDTAVQTTGRAGMRYEQARALYFLARVMLAGRRSRTDAANALGLAHTRALELGARPLTQMVEELAAQAHLHPSKAPALGEDASSPVAEDLQLTPREREILSHIVVGETYAQIAASVFISEKTVGVHVSNLLSTRPAPQAGSSWPRVLGAPPDGSQAAPLTVAARSGRAVLPL